MNKRKTVAALKRAVKSKGGVPQLAAAIEISPQAVRQLLKGDHGPSARTCIRIQRVTDGAVMAHDLRPDLFDDVMALAGRSTREAAE